MSLPCPSTLPPAPSSLPARPPTSRDLRVVRVSNVPWAATASNILEHFAAASPISCSKGKNDESGSYSIAYVYFGSSADRKAAQGLDQSVMMGRKLWIRHVVEGFSFWDDDQVVAMGEIDYSGMAKSSDVRASSTDDEESSGVPGGSGAHQMDSGGLGSAATDPDVSVDDMQQEWQILDEDDGEWVTDGSQRRWSW